MQKLPHDIGLIEFYKDVKGLNDVMIRPLTNNFAVLLAVYK